MNLNATILGQGISFFLFVWFCMKYIWPPILIAIEERQKNISDSLFFIKKERKNLLLDQNNVRHEIECAKKEAFKIINNANQQRDIILENAKTAATKESDAIFIKMQLDIETERTQMLERIHQDVGNLALKIAEKIIERSVRKNENNDIINQFINKL
ncbi:MAG TPA: F0F1 ATP synthase subunit B [Buchnera sp. (in: enterobacteria)]|nr:F0F1 ATP synthase subunit B [Buchnera sp. (in: enterobacteria)]